LFGNQSGFTERELSLTKTKSQKARARGQNKRAMGVVLKGSGAYDMSGIKQSIKGAIRAGLMLGGGAIGAATKLPGGMVFGKELGSKLSKLIGTGDYQANVSANDLIRPPVVCSASFAGENGDCVRIRRREFLQDISTSTVAGAFANYAFSINAGLHATFPFLSQFASNYEEFCFDGLVFEFVSSASPYITGSSLGTVVASMEYNSTMPPYASKFTMENSAHAVSARLDKNLMYGVECAKGANVQNCYYVRSGTSTLPTTTTDLGNFQLAVAPSVNVPVSTVVGELWVTYDVVLKRPYISGNTGLYHRYSGAATALLPFGTNTITQTNLGASNFSYVNGTNIAFNNVAVGDTFVATWLYVGTVGAVVAYPAITYTGAVAVNALNGDAASVLNTPAAGVTSITASQIFTFTATASSGLITFGTAGTLPTGSIYVELLITYVGPNVLPANW